MCRCALAGIISLSSIGEGVSATYKQHKKQELLKLVLIGNDSTVGRYRRGNFQLLALKANQSLADDKVARVYSTLDNYENAMVS